MAVAKAAGVAGQRRRNTTIATTAATKASALGRRNPVTHANAARNPSASSRNGWYICKVTMSRMNAGTFHSANGTVSAATTTATIAAALTRAALPAGLGKCATSGTA